MQQELLKQLNSFYQAVYEANRHLTEMNVCSFEKLVNKQFGYISSCTQKMNNQVDIVTTLKSPIDYWRVQGEMVKECSEKSVALSKEMMDILAEARGEFNTWLEQGLAQVTDLTVVVDKKAA